MALTPLDIHNKEFNRGLRGYNVDEVNDFLDQVIKDYESVLRDKKQLESKIEELEDSLQRYKDMEESLQKSMVVAEQNAVDIKDNAEKEGELIKREAEKNADRIVNEAFDKSRQAENEVEELKKQSRLYRTKFRMLVESHLQMIDDEDWDRLTVSLPANEQMLHQESSSVTTESQHTSNDQSDDVVDDATDQQAASDNGDLTSDSHQETSDIDTDNDSKQASYRQVMPSSDESYS